MNLEKSLLSTINKLVGTLKQEDELIEVLKENLQKKSLKSILQKKQEKVLKRLKR